MALPWRGLPCRHLGFQHKGCVPLHEPAPHTLHIRREQVCSLHAVSQRSIQGLAEHGSGVRAQAAQGEKAVPSDNSQETSGAHKQGAVPRQSDSAAQAAETRCAVLLEEQVGMLRATNAKYRCVLCIARRCQQYFGALCWVQLLPFDVCNLRTAPHAALHAWQCAGSKLGTTLAA